jgi:hypothetical protein
MYLTLGARLSYVPEVGYLVSKKPDKLDSDKKNNAIVGLSVEQVSFTLCGYGHGGMLWSQRASFCQAPSDAVNLH